MTSRFRIYPYGPSNTARDLGEALDGLLILRTGSRYRWRHPHVVVNWGSSAAPAFLGDVAVLNKFAAVRTAISKQQTFMRLHEGGVSVPEITFQQEVAQEWLAAEHKVVARNLDTGHGGNGITVYHPRHHNQVGQHRLYVKYWRKEREFRIHVFNGNIIFQQEKVKHHGSVDTDPYIRSHSRGWGFAFQHLQNRPVPSVVQQIALDAVRVLDLDFGGVDVGWNSGSGACVFEVNTAPGLENSSLKAYVGAFNALPV